MQNRLNINNLAQLTELLSEKHQVSITNWGKGNAKSCNDLYKEIIANDCFLVISNGVLIRVVELMFILIRRGDYVLIEVKQILADGRERKRYLPLAEKRKNGESIYDLITRALSEEMANIVGDKINPNLLNNLSQYFDDNKYLCIEEDPKESHSYPNLLSKYITHIVELINVNDLPLEEFVSSEKRGDNFQFNIWNWTHVDEAIKLDHRIAKFYAETK